MERKKLIRTSIPATTLLPEETVQELNEQTISPIKSTVKRLNMDMPQDL